MRESLFRGKRVDNGEWIDGFYAKSGDRTFILIDNDFAVGYVIMKEVYPETVGQFTGLTDENGRKVFEGDILIDDNNWFKGLVVFRHIGISPDFDDSCEGSGFYAVVQRIPYRGLTYICSSKIIGNIHDNPDLWEEEE